MGHLEKKDHLDKAQPVRTLTWYVDILLEVSILKTQWLICMLGFTVTFRWCSSPADWVPKKAHPSLGLHFWTSADRFIPFVPKNPPSMSKQKLDIQQTGENFILSSHLPFLCDCVPAVSFLFWYLQHVQLHWALLGLSASLLAWMSLLSYDLIHWLKGFHPKNSSWLHDFLFGCIILCKLYTVKRAKLPRGCPFWCRDHNVWQQSQHVQSHFSSLYCLSNSNLTFWSVCMFSMIWSMGVAVKVKETEKQHILALHTTWHKNHGKKF